MADSKLIEAGNIIASIVAEEPCRFDHHGCCQEHFFLQSGDCPQGVAQKWLKENRPDLWNEIWGNAQQAKECQPVVV